MEWCVSLPGQAYENLPHANLPCSGPAHWLDANKHDEPERYMLEKMPGL